VDSLGETVVRLDKAMARLKLAQGQPSSNDELVGLLEEREVHQEYMVNCLKLKYRRFVASLFLSTVAFSTSVGSRYSSLGWTDQGNYGGMCETLVLPLELLLDF